MSATIFNAIIALVAVLVLLIIWVGVHLLAQRRFGQRHLGCSGPILADDGSQVCCHTGKACDLVKAPEDDDEASL